MTMPTSEDIPLHEGGGNTAYIARICHEVNRAYCLAMQEESIAVPWEEVGPEIQKSAIYGVQFLLANPDATPESQHESWRAQKIADGWVYGKDKSFTSKTHPCLVPYAELPQAQKVKDYLFQAVIRSAHLKRKMTTTPATVIYEDGGR